MDFLIARDEPLIQELAFKARLFVEGLSKNQPPETDPERDIYIPPEPELDQWQTLAADYRQTEEWIEDFKTKIAPLLLQQADIEKGFLALMGNFAQAESAGLRISRFMQQGSIDYKAALMALHPDIDSTWLDTFRKKASERTWITLKDEDKATVPFSMDEVLSVKQQSDYWF